MTDLQARPETVLDVPKPTHVGVEKRWHGYARSTVKHLLLIALGVVMLYPLLWMLSSSIKPNDAIFREPGLIPNEFDFSNYTVGWNALLTAERYALWPSVVSCTRLRKRPATSIMKAEAASVSRVPTMKLMVSFVSASIAT